MGDLEQKHEQVKKEEIVKAIPESIESIKEELELPKTVLELLDKLHRPTATFLHGLAGAIPPLRAAFSALDLLITAGRYFYYRKVVTASRATKIAAGVISLGLMVTAIALPVIAGALFVGAAGVAVAREAFSLVNSIRKQFMRKKRIPVLAEEIDGFESRSGLSTDELEEYNKLKDKHKDLEKKVEEYISLDKEIQQLESKDKLSAFEQKKLDKLKVKFDELDKKVEEYISSDSEIKNLENKSKLSTQDLEKYNKLKGEHKELTKKESEYKSSVAEKVFETVLSIVAVAGFALLLVPPLAPIGAGLLVLSAGAGVIQKVGKFLAKRFRAWKAKKAAKSEGSVIEESYKHEKDLTKGQELKETQQKGVTLKESKTKDRGTTATMEVLLSDHKVSEDLTDSEIKELKKDLKEHEEVSKDAKVEVKKEEKAFKRVTVKTLGSKDRDAVKRPEGLKEKKGRGKLKSGPQR